MVRFTRVTREGLEKAFAGGHSVVVDVAVWRGGQFLFDSPKLDGCILTVIFGKGYAMIRAVEPIAVVLVLMVGWPCFGATTDIADVAYKIVLRDISQAEWKAYVADTQSRFRTWSNDNPSGKGNLKRFLDDKLLTRAMGVPSGKIESLKNFMYWMALYREFKEPPPWYIRYMAHKHGDKFAALLDDFSWQKFSEMVVKKSKAIQEERKTVKARHKKAKAEKEEVYDNQELDEFEDSVVYASPGPKE